MTSGARGTMRYQTLRFVSDHVFVVCRDGIFCELPEDVHRTRLFAEGEL
jgi:hypothetical protein